MESNDSAENKEAQAQKAPEHPEIAGTAGAHEVLAWLKEHGTTLAISVAVAALAFAAIGIFRTHRSSTERRAADMLGTARTVQQIEDVLQQYPGSAIAPHALIRLAKEHYAALDYAKADETYKRFLEKYPTHEWAPTARLGQVLCMEAAGRMTEALQGFTDFAAQHADHYQWGQAVIGQARCLVQLDRSAEARTVLEDLIAKAASGPWSQMAEQMLERLGDKKDAAE